MDKDYAQWKWVTADEKLTTQPCELIYAIAVSNDDKPKDNILYDGEDTNGTFIVNLQSDLKECIYFEPPEPVKCNRGLYLDFGSNTEGVFVMWRNLPLQ